jgi:hypothetical protein
MFFYKILIQDKIKDSGKIKENELERRRHHFVAMETTSLHCCCRDSARHT